MPPCTPGLAGVRFRVHIPGMMAPLLLAALAATAGEDTAKPDTGPTLPPEALAPTPLPPLAPGRIALSVLAAVPAHLASTALVLGAACSGEVIDVRCGKGLEGNGGALALTGSALALLPPLASGAIVYGLGGDEGHTPSFWWTVGAGATGQAVGFGLAMATGEPTVGFLSLTLLPVAAELIAARLTLTPDSGTPPGPSRGQAVGQTAPAAPGAAPLGMRSLQRDVRPPAHPATMAPAPHPTRSPGGPRAAALPLASGTF